MGGRARLRHACAGAVAAAALCAAAQVVAQPAAVSPALVVKTFVQGCIGHAGDAAAVTDWALAQGFEPVQGEQQHSMQELLQGDRGSVLQAPRSAGQLLLAVGQAGRCVVWAEGQDGPSVRLGLLRELSALAGRGARSRIDNDRTVEAGGLWRNLTQWRYRASPSAPELRLGAATTLGVLPAAQALHLAPLGDGTNAAAPGAPDPR